MVHRSQSVVTRCLHTAHLSRTAAHDVCLIAVVNDVKLCGAFDYVEQVQRWIRK